VAANLGTQNLVNQAFSAFLTIMVQVYENDCCEQYAQKDQ